MPNRILRDWTDSFRVERLTAEAERLFTRLIMKADDYGRYHADPRLIMAGCFPLLESITVELIDKWLLELKTADVVVTYTVKGRDYLAIIDFKQRNRLKKSKFPPRDNEPFDWLPTHDGQMTGICQASFRVDGEDEVNQVEAEEVAADSQKCPTNDGHMHARATTPNTNTPPSPTPSDARARPPVRLHGIPDTIEEVIAFGATCRPVVPPETCRKFWSYYEGQARKNPNGQVFWITSGEAVVTNWKAKLPEFGQPMSSHASTARQQVVNGNTGTANEGRAGDWSAAARRKLDRSISNAGGPKPGGDASGGA